MFVGSGILHFWGVNQHKEIKQKTPFKISELIQPSDREEDVVKSSLRNSK